MLFLVLKQHTFPAAIMFHFIKVEPLRSCLLFKEREDIKERKRSFLCVLREVTSNELEPIASS